jgi:DNA-binding MltR family transcriptional regulator
MDRRRDDSIGNVVPRTTMSEIEQTPEMVERVAKALYDSAVRQAFDAVSAAPVDIEKIGRVLDEVRASSDRAAAILLFALIDDLTIFHFSRYLNHDIRGGVASLFEANGMLSTANNRFTLAAAMFWIDQETYADLHIVRKIRNHFAHETEISSFDHERVNGLIHSLSHSESPILKTDELEFLREFKLSCRCLFLVRSGLLVNRLVQDLIVRHPSMLHRVSPRDVMNVEWEKQPQNIASLTRCIARFALQVIGTSKPKPRDSSSPEALV